MLPERAATDIEKRTLVLKPSGLLKTLGRDSRAQNEASGCCFVWIPS
jgi:hypothetical protein